MLSVVLMHLSGDRSGQVHEFAQDRVLIGRGQGNDLQYDAFADAQVSSRHAEMLVSGDAVTLRDLGSLNGTFVNGERIDTRVLAEGDTLQFGTKGPRLLFNVKFGASAR